MTAILPGMEATYLVVLIATFVAIAAPCRVYVLREALRRPAVTAT